MQPVLSARKWTRSRTVDSVLWEQAGAEVGKRVCVCSSLPRNRKELAHAFAAGPPPPQKHWQSTVFIAHTGGPRRMGQPPDATGRMRVWLQWYLP